MRADRFRLFLMFFWSTLLLSPPTSSRAQQGMIQVGETVQALVQFRGDPIALEAMGAKIHSVFGDVATVEIPSASLETVTQLPQVVRWRSARRLRPLLDVSVAAVKARGGVWTQSGSAFSGNTGQNVVVGVVDTGIDLQHADFQRDDGESRVLYLWDQTQSGFLRFPPTEYGYGMECTQAGIVLGGCPQIDTVGHGTHVAGISAGDGSGSGNGQLGFRYIGVAPGADLIIVKTDFLENHILDGINYIQKRADALGKPSVINLSLGSHIDPHDGTSLFTRALDQASGPGHLIVAAMGNERRARIHVTGVVPPGGSVVVPFDVPNDPPELPVALSIWYSGSDRMAVTVSNPARDCMVSLPAPVNTGDPFLKIADCAPIWVASSLSQDAMINPSEASNGDREILIALGNEAIPPAVGRWEFRLDGSSVSSGRFDAWTEDAAFNSGTEGEGIPAPGGYWVNRDHTLVNTAAARRVIAVGSYVSRSSWPSESGTISSPSVIEELSFFSSFGPPRPCTNTQACPSVQKPDLVAPGEWVMSTLSKTMVPSSCSISLGYTSSECNEPDGVHTVLRGTSMAAPHATGAIALLLQWQPTATPEDIRAVLTSTVQYNSQITSVGSPNKQWGYGILDVQAALAAITVPDIPGPPLSLTASAGNQSVTLGWTAPALHVQGYQVFRGTSPGSADTLLNPSQLIESTRFTDTELTNGITYYYQVQAVDTVSARMGAKSSEISATPFSPQGDGGCLITRLYGNPSDPRLEPLREMRDYLRKGVPGGESLVNLYYRTGPWVWRQIEGNPGIRWIMFMLINGLVQVWNVGQGPLWLSFAGGLLFIFLIRNVRFRSCYRMVLR